MPEVGRHDPLINRRDLLKLAGAGVALVSLAPFAPACDVIPIRPDQSQQKVDLYRSIVSSGENVYFLSKRTILERYKIPSIDDPNLFAWRSIAEDPAVTIYHGVDQPRLLATVSNITSNLAPSTDGKVVFATKEGNILEIGPEDKKPTEKYKLGNDFKSISVLDVPLVEYAIGELAFVQDKKLYTVNPFVGGISVRLRQLHTMESRIAYSPHGNEVAYTHWSGVPYYELQLLNLGSDQTMQTNIDFSADPDWNSDGRLAFAGKESSGHGDGIFILSPGKGSERLQTDLYYPKQPRWSPDGQLLAFTADGKTQGEQTGRHIYIADLQKQLNRIVIGSQGVSDYAWLPDSKRIAMIGDKDNATGEGFYYQLLNIPK